MGVPEMPYWDFQPAGNLKYLISFPFQLYLNFKQNAILPSHILFCRTWEYCFQGTSINPWGGIDILLRDTMYRVKSGFHQTQNLNSSALDSDMFPTSKIVCFNKYSSRLFKVIQNT